MSQVEQAIERLFGRRPEIESCYRAGLVNRRALARYLVAQREATAEQLEAVVAALRRRPAEPPDPEPEDLARQMRIGLKDRVLVLEFGKGGALLQELGALVGRIAYDEGETLKLVVGTRAVKLFVDESMEPQLRRVTERFPVRSRAAGLSEISLTFPKSAMTTRGVVAHLMRALALRGVVVREMLTSSPELLLYVEDRMVGEAYSVLRDLQRDGGPPGGRTRTVRRSVPDQRTR